MQTIYIYKYSYIYSGYICVYSYVYAYIYIYIHMFIHIYILHMCIHLYVHILLTKKSTDLSQSLISMQVGLRPLLYDRIRALAITLETAIYLCSPLAQFPSRPPGLFVRISGLSWTSPLGQLPVYLSLHLHLHHLEWVGDSVSFCRQHVRGGVYIYIHTHTYIQYASHLYLQIITWIWDS